VQQIQQRQHGQQGRQGQQAQQNQPRLQREAELTEGATAAESAGAAREEPTSPPAAAVQGAEIPVQGREELMAEAAPFPETDGRLRVLGACLEAPAIADATGGVSTQGKGKQPEEGEA